MDIIFQMLFDLVFCLPGALVRWVIHRGRISFSELKKDIVKNSAIGAMTIAFAAWGIYSLKQ